MADEKERYDCASLFFGDKEIVMDSFKVSYKNKATRLYGTNDTSPYDVRFSEEEVSWEATQIDDKYSNIMKGKVAQQKLREADAYIVAYDKDQKRGDLIERDVLKNPWIESWDDESGGEKFTVKGGALSIKSAEV